jgi:hypothetical protein
VPFKVNDFFNNVVLYKREHTFWVHSNAELRKKVSYHECLSQLNVIDCWTGMEATALWKIGQHDDCSGRPHKKKPTPADVVRTAETQLGEVIPYMTAYRALHSENWEQKYMQRKNFELIIPYIEAQKKANEGSVIDFSWDSNKYMSNIHAFPGFMNEFLSYVHPVVSLDTAHLQGVHKGTLYVASVLSSGANNVYPIGFMISKKNKDGNTWTRMLTLLKEACPILS